LVCIDRFEPRGAVAMRSTFSPHITAVRPSVTLFETVTYIINFCHPISLCGSYGIW